MIEHDTDGLLEESCRQGKEISICVKITDTEKAINLMSTMYPREGKENTHGVEVYSWGNFDEVEALGNKIKAIEDEVTRHNMEISNIMTASLRSFLTKE